MGTLGQYLRDARTARGIDLREASQQTRIGLQYLQALEAEDFSRLPGEVFVKGFLKNYSKFLRLDEALIMQKYSELRGTKPAAPPPAAGAPAAPVKPVAAATPEEAPPSSSKLPLEPFIWGAGIIAVLVLFLFAALPSRHGLKKETLPAPVTTLMTTTPTALATAPALTAIKSDKLYLEVIALENTWILVRTDASPQKKATLIKGDRLTWSADERFILSYGSVSAVKLALNGRELIVDEPKNAVVRDLAIVSSGIIDKKLKVEPPRQVKPKPKSAATATIQTQERRRPVVTKPTPTGIFTAPVQSTSAPISQEQRTVPQPVAPLMPR
jgi:hypothetical protein